MGVMYILPPPRITCQGAQQTLPVLLVPPPSRSRSPAHVDVGVVHQLVGDVLAAVLQGLLGHVGISVPAPAGRVRVGCPGGCVLYPRGRHDAHRLACSAGKGLQGVHPVLHGTGWPCPAFRWFPAAAYPPAWPGAGQSPPHCQRCCGIFHRRLPHLVPESWHWPSPHRGRRCPCQRCRAPAGRWCRSGSERGAWGFKQGQQECPPQHCPTHLGQGHVGKGLHGQDALLA